MAQRNRAGEGLSSNQARMKFGAKNTQAGESAERHFGELVDQSPLVNDYQVFYSLRLPRVRGQKDYNGVDVDVAFLNGNAERGYRIYLVDVKGWSAKNNAIYWSIFGNFPFRGLSPLMHKQSWTMSKSGILALNRYRDYFKGVADVSSLVAFTGTGPNRDRLPTSVTFFNWPGGIRSHLDRAALKKVRRTLGKPVMTPDNDPVALKLSGLQKRSSKRRS